MMAAKLNADVAFISHSSERATVGDAKIQQPVQLGKLDEGPVSEIAAPGA
jgi:hypothetical protein